MADELPGAEAVRMVPPAAGGGVPLQRSTARGTETRTPLRVPVADRRPVETRATATPAGAIEQTMPAVWISEGAGAGWWRRIPARLWFAAVVVTAPLRAIVMVLDALVALAVISVIGVGWAWWTQRITDDQVAQVLAQLGARGLSILSKSGVL